MKYFGIYYIGYGMPELCEVEDGVCYEAYALESEARGVLNRFAGSDWRDQYTVLPIKDGVRVWDRATNAIATASAHEEAA